MKTTHLLVIAALGALALSASLPAAAGCPQTFSGTVWQTFEAESGTKTGNYRTGTTGGQTYWATNGDNTNGNGSLPSCGSAGCVDFSFTITAGDVGYYKFQASVIAPNNGEDSIFGGIVGTNDTCRDGSGWGSSGGAVRYWKANKVGGWQWQYLTDKDSVNRSGSAADARVWYLAAGSYTFRLIGRENNFLVDKVRIMRSVVNTPTPTPSITRTATFAGSPTRTPTPFGTATRTASPTYTPTPLPTVWAGLPQDMRPYGLEYIPFPFQNVTGGTFEPLEVTFTTAAANKWPRNTARWRIVFQDLTETVGTQIAIETRIGPHGVTCTTGSFDSASYSAATTLYIPMRPQNLSTTYMWIDAEPPISERFDAVGDPRFMPYKDCLGLPINQPYADSYNWFWRNFSTTSYLDLTQTPRYMPFLPQADFDNYNGGPNFDVPKLFGFIREGIVSSASIFNSITGYSAYYAGIGGEIGGDSANKLTNGIKAVGGPWGSGSLANVDEIIGAHDTNTVDGVVLARTSTWYSKPFIGELWPDSLYISDWEMASNTTVAQNWGNLTNNQVTGYTATGAYRDELQNLTATSATTDKNYYKHSIHRTDTKGCATLLNGNGGSNTFNHDGGTSFNAALLYDGQVMAADYNFSMPTSFSVNRQWGLSKGGNQPPEWLLAPYSNRRLTLAIYSGAPVATAPSNTWGFYNNSGASGTDRASAAVRALDSTGAVSPDGLPAAGWFVLNGLAPSTDSGINFVARFSILSCLRTFHDAGAPTQFASWTNLNNKVSTNTFRMGPIPLITISEPAIGQQTKGLANISIKWNERYARWDGARYTENYPCLDVNAPPCSSSNASPNPLNEWHDPAQIAYNVKYSSDGNHWFSALTDDPATTGVYMDGPNSIAGNATYNYTYTWSVASLSPPGTKTLRVECYRPKIGQHYSYHEVSFVTGP